MEESDGDLSSPFHDISTFSGLFGNTLASEIDSETRCGFGVVKDIESNQFVAAIARSHRTVEPQIWTFSPNSKGLRDWSAFLAANVAEQEIGSVCADISFLEFLHGQASTETNSSPPTQRGGLPNNARPFQIRPIMVQMVSAYLSVLRGNVPSAFETAAFLALVSNDSLTHQFLTLTGMAQSAQDIIRFLNSSLLADSVVAEGAPGANELFILGRTEETTQHVDAAEFGFDYFTAEAQHKTLLKPYRIKLAVLSVCSKYAIGFDYFVLRGDDNAPKDREKP